jgi:curved DNA-binding protein CbpA
MGLALLSALGWCALNSTDNPYEILGVSRTATRKEIRSAYVKLTSRFYPDRVRESERKEFEQIWMKVHDAYELLMDEKSRDRYDRCGIIGEELAGLEYESGDYGFRSFREPWNDFTTQEVDSKNFSQILTKVGEMIVFVYNGRDQSNTPRYAQFFELEANDLRDLSTFVRIDVTQDYRMPSHFGVNKIPAFLYLRLEQDGSITHRIGRASSYKGLHRWIISCWNPSISYHKSVPSLLQWLNSNSEYTRIVAFERENEATVALEQFAGSHRQCRVAMLTGDELNARRTFNISRIPAKIAFRGNHQFPFADVDKLLAPVLARLRQKHLRQLCFDYCLLYIGTPSTVMINTLTNFTQAPTTWISPNSDFATSLKMHEGEWVLISGGNSSYAAIEIRDIGQGSWKTAAWKALSVEVDRVFEDMTDVVIDLITNVTDILIGGTPEERLAVCELLFFIVAAIYAVYRVMRCLGCLH